MSLTAVVKLTGVGGAKSAAYIFPTTWVELAKVLDASAEGENPVMAVCAIGLTPISPVTMEPGTVEMPDLARMVKLPDVPRFTGESPIDATALVVKLHATGFVMAMPAALVAAVLTVAV